LPRALDALGVTRADAAALSWLIGPVITGTLAFDPEAAPPLDRPLGVPGETGASGDCGTVLGLDGLSVGAVGGTGFTNCACADPNAKHTTIALTHPAATSFARATR
jgi:hypothetical protein